MELVSAPGFTLTSSWLYLILLAFLLFAVLFTFCFTFYFLLYFLLSPLKRVCFDVYDKQISRYLTVYRLSNKDVSVPHEGPPKFETIATSFILGVFHD